MTKSKHTPGPWAVLPEEQNVTYIRVRGARLGGRYKVANVPHVSYLGAAERERDETRANASLIAAAPALLAACEAMSAHYSASLDHQPAYVRLARAAIAEAKQE